MYAVLIRGAKFREAFRKVGGLRASFDAPFMALTASAPPAVQSDIIASLFLTDPAVVSQDLNRRNVFISASPIRSLDVGSNHMLPMCDSVGFM